MPVSRCGEPLCEPLHQMAQVVSAQLLALADGAVRLRELVSRCEMLGAALLRGRRGELVDEGVEPIARRHGCPRCEVRERAVDAMPERLPAVLLDAPGRRGCRLGLTLPVAF